MLKTIVISLTLFIVKYCLCIGNAADILFSHSAIISGVREAGAIQA